MIMLTTLRANLVIAIAFMAIACVRPVVFQGTSMLPAINDGDRLLITKEIEPIRRGDIVQFKYPRDPSKFYIKRVVGLPNEVIEIRDGVVLIDGLRLPEEYVHPEYNATKANFSPKRIDESEYFVMGDNRDNSSDSRYWGTVNKGLMVGKYTGTYLGGTNK